MPPPLDLPALDRDRVLNDASAFLAEKPQTVTAFHSDRAARWGATPHDFFSEGDYWWPHPTNPNGPYIRRDGLTNPDNFTAHRLAMIRMSRGVAASAAAFKLTQERKYADAALTHLRAWFIDPNTLMNPSLEYAQAIQNKTKGRGIGIIDTLHLIEPFQAAKLLEPAVPKADTAALKSWLSQYLTWLTTSKNGQEERDAQNNHGTCFALQLAAFASYTGDADKLTQAGRLYTETLLPNQLAPDGSFPKELARTKPYGYSLFNLDAFTSLAHILGGDAWKAANKTGQTLKDATAYLHPYLKNKNTWPHKKDVLHWDAWPVRTPSLLFAGLAYNEPKWLETWKSLPATTTNEEVIRNWPLRTPLLWI